MDELSRYYGRIRKVYKQFESDMDSPNAEIYKYEIPGGQYSNLLAQVTSMGSGEHFEEIKSLYKDANDLLGNIVKVTPSSKAVGDLAIFMFQNGLTKDNILTEGASLSYPDSIFSYFEGMMGQPEGGFPKELQKIVLKGKEPITVRPGSLLEPANWDEIKKHLHEIQDLSEFDDDAIHQKAISYALYPAVYDDYCKHFQEYSDVTRLESHVYFYGLRPGEETSLRIEEGKDIIIKLIGVSKADDEGKRNVIFEVNGSRREIKVQDNSLAVADDNHLKADKNNPQHLGSSIPGTVGKIMVKEGDPVEVNQPLMTVEAMKMETTVVSKINGTVDKIYVSEGDSVKPEDLMMSFHLAKEEPEEE